MTEQEFGSLKENMIVYNTSINLLYKVSSWFYPEKTKFTGNESLSLTPISLNAYDSSLCYSDISNWELFNIEKAPIELRVVYLEYQMYRLQSFVYDRLK